MTEKGIRERRRFEGRGATNGSLLLVVFICASTHACMASDGFGFEFLGPGALILPGASGPPDGVDVGDIDGDGDPDVVACFGSDEPSLRSYLADSPLCWSETASVPATFAGSLLLADVVGDGALDALVHRPGFNSSLAIFTGGSDGSFALGPVVHTGNISLLAQVAVVDLDADGHTDVILAGESSSVIYGPAFERAEAFPQGQLTASGLAVFDVDADGRKDVLLTLVNFPPYLKLLRQLTGRRFFEYLIAGGGSGPLHVADTDGDGTTEFVARAPAGGLSAFTLERLGGEWQAVGRALESEPHEDFGDYVLADIDRDGLDDAFQISGYGLAVLLKGSASAAGLVLNRGPPVTALPGRAWRITGVREVNGDDYPDILLGWSYLLGDGRGGLTVARRAGDHVGSTGGATADIDGDGFEDLIQRVNGSMEIRFGSAGGLEPPLAGSQPELSGSGLAVGRLEPGGPVYVFTGDYQRIRLGALDASGRLGGWQDFRFPFVTFTELALVPGSGGSSSRLLAIARRPDGSRTLSTFEAPGAGTLREVGQPISVSSSASMPRSVDVDGDGQEDYLFATSEGVRLLRGGPAGIRAYTESASVPWEDIQATAALDIESDGRWEAVAARGSGEPAGIRLLRRDENGTWSEALLSQTETYGLRAADLDADGHTDLVAGTRAGFKVFFNQGGAGFTEPPFTVPAPADLPLETVDLDGDGRLDIVSGGYSDLSVSYARTDGSHNTVVDLVTLRTSVSRLHQGDFNGDGVGDFYVNYEFGNDEVILAEPGGSYGPPVVIDGVVGATRVTTVGDFDGDGKLDLVTISYGAPGVLFAPGLGDGSFAAHTQLGGIAEGTIFFENGDLDRDGAEDLLVGGIETPLHIVDGGPGFASQSPRLFNPGMKLYELILVDVDGNGDLDCLLYGEDNRNNRIWRVLSGDGQGSFGAPLPMQLLTRPYAGSLFADLNGDAIPDTVTVESRRVVVLIGNGDFTFMPGDAIELVGEEPNPVAFADFNGDGTQDLLGFGSSGRSFIALGVGRGTLAVPAFFAGGGGGFAGLLDVNGDGLQDILTHSGGGRPAPLQALLASRESILETARLYRGAEHFSLTAGDFNGDERPELAVTSGRWRVPILAADGRDLRGVGEAPVAGVAPTDLLYLAAQDLDADGFDDLVFLTGGKVMWLRSRGDFTFADAVTIVEGMQGNGITFADIDADGLRDIIVSGFSVARALGGGLFAPPRGYRADDGFTANCSVLDFDGDGALDVAQPLGRGGTILFSAGNGKGGFEGVEFLPTGGDGNGVFAVGDFDGNRLLDIAMGSRDGDTAVAPRVWYMQPGGSLLRGDDLHDPLRTNDGTNALAAIDLNEDGFDDLLSSDPGGYALVYPGGPGGLEGPAAATYAPSSPTFMFAGNFAGGAAVDLLTAGEDGLFITAGTRLRVLFSRGDVDGDGQVNITDPIFLLSWLFLGGRLPPCMDAGDGNDDGRVDLSDSIYVLRHLYTGAPPPPEPYLDCAEDPTRDSLTCESFAPCAGAPPP